jgi:hypothetical protein
VSIGELRPWADVIPYKGLITGDERGGEGDLGNGR